MNSLRKAGGVINPDFITPRFVYKNRMETRGVISFPVLNIHSYFKAGSEITPRAPHAVGLSGAFHDISLRF